ncbi:soluble NSF attachment protein [Bisporella sp. PMI_857]|nr:soluble NSF attachment protein [Bisporella sp. PMI_857]
MAQDPRAILQKADKAASGASGGFSLFGGRQEKWESAADLYSQAANAFRMAKQNKEAGQAFEKAANIQTNQLSEPDDAANTLIEAFKVYRKTDPLDAVRCLDTAINHYTSKGNFRRAATHKEKLAEVWEQEIGDLAKAKENYSTAASWFESDNAEALANKLYLKAADIAVTLGATSEHGDPSPLFHEAIEQYEKVAQVSIGNNLMRWSVKDYFFKSGLSYLALNDFVATTRALEKYRDMDPQFASTREHALLEDLLKAMENKDQDEFAQKLFEFDQISKLDKWKTTICLKIKNSITDDEDFS